MKRHQRELLFLLLQFLLVYVYPCFSASAGPMGMVLVILAGTLLLSLLAGLLCRSRLRFLYPPAAALLFLPSVFLYYNESALVHSLWYLVVSAAGLLTGSLARLLARRHSFPSPPSSSPHILGQEVFSCLPTHPPHSRKEAAS